MNEVAGFDVWLVPSFSPETEKEAIDISLWLWECSELIAKEIKDNHHITTS